MLEFHRADTFRRLFPGLIAVALFTAGVAWLEMDCLCLAEVHPLKNITSMHSLLGFAISMLLVFRTNTAYDRWWEARKQWGNLVHASCNLASKVGAFTAPEDEASRAWFAEAISRFSQAVQRQLGLPQQDPSSQPLDLSAEILEKITELCGSGKIAESRIFLLVQEVNCLADAYGACDRIRHSPIPLSYYLFIKKFIVLYTLTLPFGFAFSLGWYAVPAVVFIFYILASLEMIAEEIEDPFGQDSTDLPMESLCLQVERDVRRILRVGSPVRG